MMTTDTEVQVMDTTERTITAQDRCDRCNAQAYVVTQHGDMDLLWCNHHYTEHEDVLAASKVLDRRGMLNERSEKED